MGEKGQAGQDQERFLSRESTQEEASQLEADFTTSTGCFPEGEAQMTSDETQDSERTPEQAVGVAIAALWRWEMQSRASSTRSESERPWSSAQRRSIWRNRGRKVKVAPGGCKRSRSGSAIAT
jgi:hypothetical protein